MATTSLEEEEYMEGERDEGWGEAGEQGEGRLVLAPSRSVSRERELHAASFPVEYDGEDDSPFLQPSERVASKRDEGDPEHSDVDHEREERDACYGWESEKEGRPEASDEGPAASREEDVEGRDDGEGGPQEGREDVGENEGEETEDLEETRRDDEDSLTISGEKGNDSDQIEERKVFVGNTPLAVREPSVERVFGEFGKLSEIKIFKHFLHLTYDDAAAATRAVEELNDKEVWGAQIVVEPLRPGAASQRPPGAGAARVVVSRGERDTGAPGAERGRGRGRSGAVAGRGKSAGSVAGARRGGRGRGGQAAGPGGKRLPFRVVCHNLDPRVHWQDLKDFGREAGEVNFTNVLHNQEGLRIGIIEYCSQEDMETALRELDGKRLFDARVEVRREEANASYPSFAEISSSLPPDSLIRPPSGRAPPGAKGASSRARRPPLRASFLDEEDPRAPPAFGGARGTFPRGRRSSEGRGESAPLPRSARPALPPALSEGSLAFGHVSPQREAPAGMMPRREKARREKVLAPAAYPAVLPLRAPRRQPGPDEAFELQPFLNGGDACDPRYLGDKHACMEGEEVRPRDSRGSRRDEPSLHTGGFPFWRQGVEDSGARERDSLPSSRERREKDEAESGRPHRRCFYVDCAGTGRVDSAGHGKEKASLNGRLHARGPADDTGRSHREEEGDARGPKRRRNDFEFMGPPVLPPPTGGPTVILPPPSGPSQSWEFGPGPERLRAGDEGFESERRRREGDLDLARPRRERDPAPHGASGDKLAWRGRAGKGPTGPKALDGFPLETVDQGRPNGVFGLGGESKHAEFRYAERGREREGEPHQSSPFRGPRGDPRGLAVVGSVRGGPGGDFRDDEMAPQRRRRPGGRGGAGDWRRDPEGPDLFPPFRLHSDRLDHGADVPCVGRERDRGRGEEDDQRRGDFGRDLDRRAEVPFDDWGQSRREGGLKYEASPHTPLGPRGKRSEKGGLDFAFPVDKPRHIYAADDGGAPLAPGLDAGPVRERDAYLGGGEDERHPRRNEHAGPPFLRRDREEDVRRREGRRGEELLHEEVPPAAGARLLGDDRRRSVSLERRYDVGVDGDRRDRGRPERGYFIGAPHHDREEPGDDGLYRGDRERSAKKPRREEDASFSREFRGAPGPRGPDRLPVQRASCNMYEARDLGREELFAHPLPGSQYPPQFGTPGLGGSLGRSMRREEDRRKEEESLSGPCARGLMPSRGRRGDSAIAKGYSHLHPQGPPCFPAATGRSGRGLDRGDEGESADGRGRFFERDPEMFRPVRGREGEREYIHLSRQREDMRMMERPYASREEGRRGGRGADREGDGALGYRDELRHH